jgi:hypothetical protein
MLLSVYRNDTLTVDHKPRQLQLPRMSTPGRRTTEARSVATALARRSQPRLFK